MDTTNSNATEISDSMFDKAVQAVDGDDIDEVRTFIQDCDTLQRWPLISAKLMWIAVEHEFYDIAELLAISGADLSLNVKPDTTIFHVIAEQSDDYRNEVFISLLTELGANVNAIDSNNWSALHCAVHYCSHNVAVALMECGINLEYANAEGETALHFAADAWSSNFLVPLMLARGANAKARNNQGMNALHYLAMNDDGGLKAANFLLDYGTPVNETEDINQCTPLHLALRLGHGDMAGLFLRRGANVNARMIHGHTPLHEAIHLAWREKDASLISTLLQLGADINAKDNVWEKTPLAAMCSKIRSPATDVIIKHLTILQLTGSPVDEKNLAVLRENKPLQSFYNSCLDEISRMSKTTVHNETCSFWSIFQKSQFKLALLSKNSDFVRAYKAYDREDAFPLYAEEMDRLFEVAQLDKDRVCAQEKLIYAAFSDHWPDTVLRIIVFYSY